MLLSGMLRTAIPFGYLFIAILLMGFLIVGIACFVFGRRTRRHAWRVIGSVLSLGVISVITMEVIMDYRMEWNPAIRKDSEVVGTWVRERGFWMDFFESVTLRADHSCEYHSDTERFTGKWERHDWNLQITAEGVDSTMRFIAYSGELRLLSQPPDDPDTWNGDLGLERVRPLTSGMK